MKQGVHISDEEAVMSDHEDTVVALVLRLRSVGWRKRVEDVRGRDNMSAIALS